MELPRTLAEVPREDLVDLEDFEDFENLEEDILAVSIQEGLHELSAKAVPGQGLSGLASR